LLDPEVIEFVALLRDASLLLVELPDHVGDPETLFGLRRGSLDDCVVDESSLADSSVGELLIIFERRPVEV
jgi:hypothetical protein